MTDREILKALNRRDLNEVRPRITELVQAGKLREVGHKYDEYSGRPVRMVQPSNPDSVQMEMF